MTDDWDNDQTRDAKYEQAVGILVLTGRGSTSFLQRRLGIGYNEAARLMERAQAEGIVAPPNFVDKPEGWQITPLTFAKEAEK